MGVRGMRWLERAFAPFAERIGFRSDLTPDHVLQLAADAHRGALPAAAALPFRAPLALTYLHRLRLMTSSSTPLITALRVIPVADRDSMLLNLSGAHGPFFTRNLLILTR